MVFHPNVHLIKISGKDYLPVQWRLYWFRDCCPSGTIDTQEIEVDHDREVTADVEVWNPEKRRREKVTKTAKGYARYKAIVTDGHGGQATGHGSETAVDFPDYAEKAETKAIGRALAALGFGTQFTGDDFIESHRIVDAPVDRRVDKATSEPPAEVAEHSAGVDHRVGKTLSEPPAEALTPTEAVTETGVSTPPVDDKILLGIGKLCRALGKAEPEYATLTAHSAQLLLNTLTHEYKAGRARKAVVPVATH